MASISREPSGRKTIQIMASDGKRKSIRLGKASEKLAGEVKIKVESIQAATSASLPLDTETAVWLSKIGEALAGKLSAVGLVPARQDREEERLGVFLQSYIDRRTDVKPNTRRNLLDCRRHLVEFFGADKGLREVAPGDADAWVIWMKERYAAGTVGRSIRHAQQLFRAATRKRLLVENPFGDLKGSSPVNEARKFFIDLETAARVLEACPNAEWRLLFALSRYGGLRCPSEHMALTWADVDWDKGKFRVASPKTGTRWVPIFPELRPFLEEAFETAPEGTIHVIRRYRDANQNLRTHMQRILRRAGLEPWPKLFHNLRASRETELAAEFPIHVVCAWLGHVAAIAQKHYLQVTDGDFERAAKADISDSRLKSAAKCGALALQNAVQQPAAPSRTESQESTEPLEPCESVRDDAARCKSLLDKGLLLPGGERPGSGLAGGRAVRRARQRAEAATALRRPAGVAAGAADLS